MSSFNSAIRVLGKESVLLKLSRSHVNRLLLRTLNKRFHTSSIKRNSAAGSPTERNSLAHVLAKAIEQKGPITIAQYMRQCLTSPDGGYYTTSEDPFGQKGDFITAPEISQLFGEMVGIWMVSEFMVQSTMGGPRVENVNLIELGPGRGTLMEDILRTIKPFKFLDRTVRKVCLVEASSVLREMQCRRLCGARAVLEKTATGWTCMSLYGHIPIEWYEDLKLVPQDSNTAPFFVAHEFFDALPIHAFQSTPAGWRELLVDVENKPKSNLLLPSNSQITNIANQQVSGTSSSGPDPTFKLSLAKRPTAHSLLVSKFDRYSHKPKEDWNIEVSFESQDITEDISKRIADSKQGAALIIDYGPADTIPMNSLRGIKSHQRHSPFEKPGKVDLSVDVDFIGLVHAALNATEGVEVHGPEEQGGFLLNIGMKERLNVLARKAPDDGKRMILQSGYERLIDRGATGMGRIYKAMAIIPEAGGRRPIGFGGSVPM